MTEIIKKSKQTVAYCGLPFILAILIILRTGHIDTVALLWYMLIAVFGYIATVLDIKTKKIPNKLVLIMLAAWAITLIPLIFLETSQAIILLIDSALGFCLGGGLFLLVYAVSRKGVGGGDVKFMAATGLYIGLYGIIPAIFYGSILAAITGLALLLLKKIKRKDKIPLAPFLYTGILITMFLS
jgi:leader peptidase (prepilin peptidase)/N-methyltransferase